MDQDGSFPFHDLVQSSVSAGASDIHLCVGEEPRIRIDGKLKSLSDLESDGHCFSEKDSQDLLDQLVPKTLQTQLKSKGSWDGAISLSPQLRLRFNVFRREGQFCFSFRHLPAEIPDLSSLGFDTALYQLCELKDGLILVAGPTGSGKSTTIAAMIDRINQNRQAHIVTIEDPVEYKHHSRQCLVNQRQVGFDVPDFATALRDAMRQDPDVILVGELRDADTIRTAITAAETGHLVFATVHAGDCKGAIERLVSVFSAEEQNLAGRLVATVLRSVIVQHLLPRMAVQNHDGNEMSDERFTKRRVVASEVLHVNTAVANLVASGNLGQIGSVIQSASAQGMWTLDDSLARLWKERKISQATARSLARNPEMLSTLVRGRSGRL